MGENTRTIIFITNTQGASQRANMTLLCGLPLPSIVCAATSTTPYRHGHEVGRLPPGPREEAVEIAAGVPGAILAERRERDEAAALARLAALHARVQVSDGVPG